MKVDVQALAKLARLEVAPEELLKLETEIPAILGFVETIQTISSGMSMSDDRPTSAEQKFRKAAGETTKSDPALHNVMRADEKPHEGGAYTDDLLKAAPASRDNQVVVKQVISKKK